MEWELVHEETRSRTMRLQVPGGWLYRMQVYQQPTTMCFVPFEPNGPQR